jgi:hypothetical protein
MREYINFELSINDKLIPTTHLLIFAFLAMFEIGSATSESSVIDLFKN